MSPIVHLAPGADVLANPYEVDGRVSWHAREARGWAPANVGLLRERDRALLIDTGLTVHREAVLAGLRKLLDDDVTLEVFTVRVGEFDSICNLLDVVEAFGVRKQYAAFDDGPLWGDIHPERRLAAIPWAGEIETEIVPHATTLKVAPGRRLDVVRPNLRNLSTYWVFDRATRTLFTSDSFCYGVADRPEGPWVVDGDAVPDDVTVEDVIAHLLTGTRFWWLQGSRLDLIREEVQSIFGRFDVEAIVPAFGRILRGRRVVERHVALLDEALARIETMEEDAA